MKKSEARRTSVRTPGKSAAGLTATHQFGLPANFALPPGVALGTRPPPADEAGMNGLSEPRCRWSGEPFSDASRLNFGSVFIVGSECLEMDAPKFGLIGEKWVPAGPIPEDAQVSSHGFDSSCQNSDRDACEATDTLSATNGKTEAIRCERHPMRAASWNVSAGWYWGSGVRGTHLPRVCWALFQSFTERLR